MEVVVEVVGRSGTVMDRQCFKRLPVTLGRAYCNDLILSDPYADPLHAELGCDEDGELQIRDLGSRNGIVLAGQNLHSDARRLEPGVEFTLGKSHLRVYRTDQWVPAALPLSSMEGVFNQLSRPGLLLGSFVLLVALTLWEKQISGLSDFKLLHHAGEVIGLSVLVMAYAAIWGLLGRILRHDSRFLAHCMIAVVALLALTLGEQLLQWLAFNLNVQSGLVYFEFVLSALVGVGVLRSSLFLATHLQRWRAHLTALVPALLLLLVGGFMQHSALQEFRPYALYSPVLYSPRLQWIRPLDQASFLEQSRATFQFQPDKNLP